MMLLTNMNGIFFIEYPSDEEASGQIETDMDIWDKVYCTVPPKLKEIPMCFFLY